jgi:hypothetical protein
MMTRLPLLLALLGTGLGCASQEDPASRSEAPVPQPAAPDVPPAPIAAKPVEAPPVPVPRSFADELAELDAAATSSVPMAVDLFVARHSDPGRDEQARFDDLELLRKLFEQVELQASHRMDRDEAFAAAVMHHLGEGEGPKPSDEARAEVEQLVRDGLRVVRIDGSLIGIDYAWLIDRAGPALSPNARSYLEALHWDQEHTARMEGDQPDELVESIDRWERLVDAGEPYTGVAYGHRRSSAEIYLEMCFYDPMDEPSRCKVTEPMRRSYRRFVAERTGAWYHPAVAHYLARAAEKRWSMSVDDAIELRDESLAKALRE